MYAIARLFGYVEEVGFKAWLSQDMAKALGVRLGDGIRLESKSGVSSARVVGMRDDVKAGLVLTLDAYMAVSGLRTVLIKRLARVFDAELITVGIESRDPLDVDQLSSLLNVMVAFRVPVFTDFTGFIQTEAGRWVRLTVKGVSPREPAYVSKATKIYVR
ncbi:MAG: molybdopterin-binding protein [Pyrobaculum sp.]